MGQHKNNPMCELAKKGLAPPRAPKLTKRERERQMRAMVDAYIYQKSPVLAELLHRGNIGRMPY